MEIKNKLPSPPANVPSASSPHRRPHRTTIEIPLPTAPRRYVPGSGPRSQPISLLPVQDSTAYIVDKVVFPSGPLARHKAAVVRRRLFYIVAWSDVPAARATVPATDVLTYVSPRALEEFEYTDLLRRDEEKRAKAAEDAAQPVKRRGRPRKHGPAGALGLGVDEVVELNAAEEALLARRKASGPSLSTPSKGRLEDLFNEEYPESDDAAIQRQLFADNEGGSGPDLMEIDSDMAPIPTSTDISEVEDYYPARRQAGSQLGKQASAMKRTLPSSAHDTTRWSSGPSQTSQLVVALNGRRSSNSSGPGSARSANHSPHESVTTTPRVRAGILKPSPRLLIQSENATRTETPSTTKTQRTTDASQWQNGTTAPRKASPTGNGPPQLFPGREWPSEKHELSTPAPPVPAPDSSRIHSASLSKSTPSQKKSKPQKQTPRKRPKKEQGEAGGGGTGDGQPGADAEGTWEVKRLENDRLYDDVDGQGPVRYFKVRWEGDWPPDQNPTWEPEDNLPASMVRQYLRKKATRERGRGGGGLAHGADGGTVARKRTKLSLTPKKYQSVTEAFEGDLDDELANTGPNGTSRAETPNDLLVVTEDHDENVIGSSGGTPARMGRIRTVPGVAAQPASSRRSSRSRSRPASSGTGPSIWPSVDRERSSFQTFQL